MAIHKTVHYTQQETATGNMAKQVTAPSGTLEFRAVTYTMKNTEAVNELIYIGKLPVGATVVPTLCSVVCADPGTTLTLDIGTAEDPDLLADGIVLSAGGRVEFTSGTMPEGALTPTKIASTDVYATVASVSSLSGSAKVVFNLVWMTPR